MSQSNDTSLNILCSYAHLYKDKRFSDLFFSLHKKGTINAMVDSGAFTKLHAKKGQYDFINIDTYCEWIKEREEYCEKYVMLDVIGCAEPSRRNYETMVSRGLHPMYVLTAYDNDWQYLRETININPNCCVAGGVQTKGLWLQQRFQEVYRQTNGKALTHGLGYVIFPDMLRLPLSSVDSSSWLKGAAYGVFFYFDSKGLHGMRRELLMKKPKGRMTEGLCHRFEQWKLTPSDIRNEEYWHGLKSIAQMSAIVAHIHYQRYCQKNGLRYFLATCSRQQLELILYVNENLNTLTYGKYRKFFN